MDFMTGKAIVTINRKPLNLDELERLPVTDRDVIQTALRCSYDIAKAENNLMRDAIENLRAVLGPKVPTCCAGCEEEWSEALRLVNEVHDRITK